jgi:hypothetical protein
MSEDVARALGAADPQELTIAGKKCRLRPLSIKELTEVQREGVRVYRKAYLTNLRDSIEFLPGGEEGFQKKVEESAHWDADDLPKKTVYDTSTLQINNKLKDWLKTTLKIDEKRLKHQRSCQSVVAASLDSELLSVEEFRQLTGKLPVKVKTGWVNWWVTGTPEGMLTMIWHSVKSYGVSRDELDALVSDPGTMMAFAREVEFLSAPSTGNG